MKSRLRQLVTWPNLTAIVLVAGAVFLLVYRLGSLTPGLGLEEQLLPPFRDSLTRLWHSPIQLPYTLAQLVTAAVLPTGGLTASRLPAVGLALVLLAVMFYVLRQWFGKRTALFGIILLATSPWLLHTARFADGRISYPLGMAVILALSTAWHKRQPSRYLPLISTVSAAVLIYVPGFIWLLLCLLYFERKNIFASYRMNRLRSNVAALAGLIILVPLGHLLLVDRYGFLNILGFDTVWPTYIDYLQHFFASWQFIFIGGYDDAAHNLSGLALVSGAYIILFVIGLYLFGKHRNGSRSKLLLALWLVGSALLSMPNFIDISLLLPIVIVVATGGIGYLLQLWLRVFPRNPLARNFGIGLISLLLVFAVGYNIRSYYIAWAHNRITRASFIRQQ